MCLHFRFALHWCKTVGAKAACRTLVKLIPGLKQLSVQKTNIFNFGSSANIRREYEKALCMEHTIARKNVNDKNSKFYRRHVILTILFHAILILIIIIIRTFIHLS